MTITVEPAAPGLGVSNGTSSKAPFDRWFRYPAGLSQQALAQLFADGHNESGGAVVDPFCGAATVGTRAAAKGISFYGIEAHPEIAKLAWIKLRTAPENLKEAAAEVVSIAAPLSSLEGEHDLVVRCFDPGVLKTLAGIRDAIKCRDDDTSEFLKWALLGTLRDVANVKVGWPYLRPSMSRVPPHSDAAGRFRTRVQWMADDMKSRTATPAATVVAGDSGTAAAWRDVPEGGFAGAISLTSPPYLNNFDYADATRLEMYFWGRNSTWREMVEDVRSDMLVATTQQSSLGGAEDALELIRDIPATRAKVLDLITALEAQKAIRAGGKEYDRVLPQYMAGIGAVLSELGARLEPGSWCGWVVGDSAPYGVYVDTPSLIQTAALELGYTTPSSEKLRDRGLRWRTSKMRHQVDLDERIIWMRAPGQ